MGACIFCKALHRATSDMGSTESDFGIKTINIKMKVNGRTKTMFAHHHLLPLQYASQ